MIKIRHTGIVTYNLKKSLYFWSKCLNFKVFKVMNEKGELIDSIMQLKKIKLKTVKLKDDNNNLLEIIYFKNLKSKDKKKTLPYTQGYTHISVTVKNINKIYEKLKKKGIKFNSIPKKSADGRVLMTYCKTPESAFLELVEQLR